GRRRSCSATSPAGRARRSGGWAPRTTFSWGLPWPAGWSPATVPGVLCDCPSQAEGKVMEGEMTSWAIATLLVSMPSRWLLDACVRHEDEIHAAFSTREGLLAHASGGPLRSPWVCWLVVAMLGGSFVGGVALVASWLRAIVS